MHPHSSSQRWSTRTTCRVRIHTVEFVYISKVGPLPNPQDLELARHDNVRLAATVAKLRTVLTAQAVGANAEAARENPHVAAWYRKAYADREWQRVPPVRGEHRARVRVKRAILCRL